MDFAYLFHEQLIGVRVEEMTSGYAVTVGEQTFIVEVAQPRPAELWLTIEGVRCQAFVAADGPRRWVAFDSRAFLLEVPRPGSKGRRRKAGGPLRQSLEAQMPGLVRKVLASAGEHVERGQVLLILEAMKMEIRLGAPHAGVIEAVRVREGETVGRGQPLVDLIATDSPA